MNEKIVANEDGSVLVKFGEDGKGDQKFDTPLLAAKNLRERYGNEQTKIQEETTKRTNMEKQLETSNQLNDSLNTSLEELKNKTALKKDEKEKDKEIPPDLIDTEDSVKTARNIAKFVQSEIAKGKAESKAESTQASKDADVQTRKDAYKRQYEEAVRLNSDIEKNRTDIMEFTRRVSPEVTMEQDPVFAKECNNNFFIAANKLMEEDNERKRKAKDKNTYTLGSSKAGDKKASLDLTPSQEKLFKEAQKLGLRMTDQDLIDITKKRAERDAIGV